MSLGSSEAGEGGTLVPSGDDHLRGTDREVDGHSGAEAIVLDMELGRSRLGAG